MCNVDFFPAEDETIFIRDNEKNILFSSQHPCNFIKQNSHNREKDCCNADPVINEKVFTNVTKCWSDESMFAFVKDNSLHVVINDENYCFERDKSILKFFEGRGNEIKQVVSGGARYYQTLFVLMKDGSVWGRGKNKWHTISGKKTSMFYDDFVQIIPSGVKMISASYSNVGILKKDNSLWVWGKNLKGKKKESSILPQKIAKNVKEFCLTDMWNQRKFIPQGTTSILFLKKNGAAYGMGSNKSYMFTGKYARKWLNRPVKLMNKVKHIEATKGKSLLLTKKNELYWAGGYESYVKCSQWMPKAKK